MTNEEKAREYTIDAVLFQKIWNLAVESTVNQTKDYKNWRELKSFFKKNGIIIKTLNAKEIKVLV